MSNPITWRSLGTPNMGDPSRGLHFAGQAFKDSLGSLQGLLTQHNDLDAANWKATKEANTNAFFNKLSQYSTPEEAQAAIPELNAMREGFGAQVDGAATRTAQSSLVENLQRKFTQNQAYLDQKSGIEERPTVAALHTAIQAAQTPEEVKSLQDAISIYSNAGNITPQSSVALMDKNLSRVTALGNEAWQAKERDQTEKKWGFDAEEAARKGELFPILLEKERVGIRAQEAAIRASNVQAANQGNVANLERLRLAANLVSNMEEKTGHVGDRTTKEITTIDAAQKDFVKASAFGGGKFTDEHATDVVATGKKLGLTPDSITNFLSDLRKDYPSNSIKLPGMTEAIPITKGMVEAALVDGAAKRSYGMDWLKGDDIYRSFKSLTENPAFPEKYKEFVNKNTLYEEQKRMLKKSGQENQDKIRNAFAPYLEAATGNLGGLEKKKIGEASVGTSPAVPQKAVGASPDGTSVDIKVPSKDSPERVSVQAIDLISGQPKKVSDTAISTLPKSEEITFYGKPKVVGPVGTAKGEWLAGGKSSKVSAQFIIPSDGDTIRANNPKGTDESFLCRFSGSDAPEIQHGKMPKQPYGEDSLKNLQNLISNKEVQITVKEGRDRYNRLICDIQVEGKDIQLEQIKGGFAWVMEQYASPEVKDAYRSAQKKAMTDKLGLWKDPNPINPSDWRRQYR